MAGRTAWVLADQLSADNPALEGADRVLLIESEAKLRSGPYHRQKLHLVLSAMRHVAAELRERGLEVDHRRAPSLAARLAAHRRPARPEEIVVLDPARAGAGERLAALDGVRVVPGALFLTTAEEFAGWADGRRRVVMEDFYRWQRRRLGVLMDGDEPAGGRWNLDADNRHRPPRDRRPPRPYAPREDAIDDEVRRDLDALGLRTWGDDGPRRWPATRDQARRALAAFVERRLAGFGPWQDAMLGGERLLWHSGLSSSLNLGLLGPLEAVRAVQQAYRAGDVPLQSAEGFVRQVIGRREYVWGVYRLRARRWRRMNALRARGDLPSVLWGEPTRMRCLSEAVGGVRATAYAHHIERLMLFGNLVLLLGTPSRAPRCAGSTTCSSTATSGSWRPTSSAWPRGPTAAR